jgi:integrative and conjugative element protein (TIGR02256 family)
MHGFIMRLDKWLADAAMDRLDPIGAPLHPPANFAFEETPLIVPTKNTPPVEKEVWSGWAHIEEVGERFEITGWSEIGDAGASGIVGAAVLLPVAMPHEFPNTFAGLFQALHERGADSKLGNALRAAIRHNRTHDPLFVVIGTPMRGTRGGALKQHLAVWQIDEKGQKALRRIVYGSAKKKREAERISDQFLEWAREARVQWCRVREARPEIVTRRDDTTPLAWFRDKKVAIWGCGALGGHLAVMLARAGVGALVLRDNKRVTPGVLLRQPFDDGHIGVNKAEALAGILEHICPDLPVETYASDVTKEPLGSDDWTDGADVIVDATTSKAVLGKVEKVRKDSALPKVPIISIVVDRQAERGFVVVAKPEHSGGTADVSRRAKIRITASHRLKAFAETFFSVPAIDELFQPEPGCSDPTFIGSAADAEALTGTLLNLVAKDLAAEGFSASAHLVTQAHVEVLADQQRQASFFWQPDLIHQDPQEGYEVRLARPAWKDIQAWIKQSARVRDADIETGGLLFGEMDDALKVVWVSEVIGPPPDSRFSRTHFECGIEGTRAINEKKADRSRDSVQFVGMWHTHPVSAPEPSPTDDRGTKKLFAFTTPSLLRSLLMIVGYTAAEPEVGVYVYQRPNHTPIVNSGEHTGDNGHRPSRVLVSSRLTVPTTYVGSENEHDGRPLPAKHCRIGLALSGGGARAMAFHLGCMRALHDRGVLGQVGAISAVSGGSLITGLYAYHDEPFEAFEERVEALLRRGLYGAIAKRTLAPKRSLQALSTAATAGLAAHGLRFLRIGLRYVPGAQGLRERIGKLHPPLRRVSRTTAFEDVLRDGDILGNRIITAPQRKNLDVIINATDLRSLSAFRFGSRETGLWRVGKLADNEVAVAHAVAASAAYPAIFPAIHRVLTFYDRTTGKERQARVVLSDGGVYDNLGVTCMEPGRAAGYGYNSIEAEYIICCSAGRGIPPAYGIPYGWSSRMIQTAESLHRKVQDGTFKRLHTCLSAGSLRGLVLVYLGQMDCYLPEIPPDLVTREVVIGYPTDFAPMSKENLDLLARRGEQLTRLLISYYCPEL